MEAINPLSRASMEGKQRKTNSHESEILSGKCTKRLLEVEEKGEQVK
jgi:hypothetical protein